MITPHCPAIGTVRQAALWTGQVPARPDACNVNATFTSHRRAIDPVSAFGAFAPQQYRVGDTDSLLPFSPNGYPPAPT